MTEQANTFPDVSTDIKTIQLECEEIRASQAKLHERLNGMGKLMLESNDAMHEVLDLANKPTRIYVVNPHCSESVGKIASALSKAQREFGGISGSGAANRGTFTTLEDMEEITTPILEKYELAVTPMLVHNEHGEFVQVMRLSHSSGEWFESRLLLKEDSIPGNGLTLHQKVGAAEKYLKRYMYRNILCLADNAKD